MSGRDQRGQLLGAHARELQQLRGPLPALQVEQAERVGGGVARRPPPGHLQGQVRLHVAHPRGAFQDVRLVPRQPGELVDRRRRVRRFAGHLVHPRGPERRRSPPGRARRATGSPGAAARRRRRGTRTTRAGSSRPIAPMRAASTWEIAPTRAARVADHHSRASCSCEAGCGWLVARAWEAWASTRPSRSRTTALAAVVEQSIATTRSALTAGSPRGALPTVSPPP